MPAIRHRVLIRADRAKIYHALVAEEGLSGWWTTDCTARPEVGFVNEFRFGKLIRNKMKVVGLEPGRRVEWECIESVREWTGTRIVFEITEKENLNFLNFSHTGWPEEGELFAKCNFNWGRYLKSLKDLCETGKGSPFDAAGDLTEVRAVTGGDRGPEDTVSARVTGIGGVFFKSSDPGKLQDWYARHLGLHGLAGEGGGVFQWREMNPPHTVAHTVWGLFTETTAYFYPSEKPFMLNFRVSDLDSLLARLKGEGVTVVGDTETYDYGKFGWIMDPEGNKIELWQPNDDEFRRVNRLG